MKNKSFNNDFAAIIITVIIVIVALVALIFYHFTKRQTIIEKGCSEEHTTFTSEVIKCPEEKPFIHLSVLDRSASVMCCEKK